MPAQNFRKTMLPLPGGGVYLERPRMDRLLDSAFKSNVVTVVAGEGSGKTYAVNSYLQRNSPQVIWVQLSERDNLGWRFWENYTGEIARLNPEAAKMIADIGFPESNRLLDRYLDLIKNEIISHERYALVFDDLHLLTNPAIYRYMEQTLTARVSKNTIVLISRTETSINTVNLLARGLLSQITAEDLRFTREEVGAYFALHNIILSAEEIEYVYSETEGWALALGLILQGIRTELFEEEPVKRPLSASRPDDFQGKSLDRMPANGGDKKRQAMKAPAWNRDKVMLPIQDMEEKIFAAMDGELQKFLIKLSLIEHWPRNFLERLEGGTKHISAMEKLSSVIRFDTYLHGYRIHHLFLEFLRAKQCCLSQEEIRAVYRTGAQWCIENNFPTDAAVDYERARDYAGLIRLVESYSHIMPRSVASFFLGVVDRLSAGAGEDEDDWDLLFLRYIVRPWFLTVLGRFDECIEIGNEAISRFKALPPGPECSHLLCSVCNNLGNMGIISAKHTRDYNFVCWFEQGYRYYQENPEPVRGQRGKTNIGSYVIQVGYHLEPGEIERFIDAYSASVPFVSASQGGYLYGADTLARAELAYYRGDLDKAEQFARQAVFQGREKTQYEVENRALFYLMRIAIHTGNVAGIRDFQEQMEVQLEKAEYLNRYTIHDIIMARFYTRLRLTKKIAPWLITENEGHELNILFRGFDTLVKSRYLFIEKRYQEALQALEAEKIKGELGNFLLGMLEMTALEAITRYYLGDLGGALTSLKQAYDIAYPNALDMPFIELGTNMNRLAGSILKTDPNCGGISRNWLNDIRLKASAYAKSLALVAAQYEGRKTSTFEDFSAHELAVLNNLSHGLTSEEIAVEMKISLKMVKSVIRTLYIKLGAANRADAIRIATKNHLLPKQKK
jgi:LuxR family maltose regulon positive regulatory protein